MVEIVFTVAVGFVIAGVMVMILSGIGLIVAYKADEPLVGLFCVVLFIVALVMTIIAGAAALGFWIAPMLIGA